MTDAAISKAYGVREQTVERLRKRLVEEGFQVALHGKPGKPRVDKKLDGEPPGVRGACDSPIQVISAGR